MLLKVFKYDFQWIIKKIIFYYIALILTAIFGRIFYELLKNSEYFLAIITIYVPIIMGVITLFFVQKVLCYVRFYKNMLSDEGYLTHTLPISRTNLFLSKVILVVVLDIFSIIVIFTVLAILLPNFFVPTEDLNWTIMSIFAFLKDENLIVIILRILLLILYSVIGDLIVYTCLDLGGIHNKHKILFSIVYYFAFSMLSYMLESFYLILFKSEIINGFFSLDSLLKLLICNCVMIVGVVILFFINNYIIKKHLNLQ